MALSKEALKPGEIINERYRIEGQVGQGGMSRVYRASDLVLKNKLWAVKEVYRHTVDQSGKSMEQSLAYESDLLSRISHPAIVNIADIYTTNDYIYIVMDYVEGRPLNSVLREEGAQSEETVQNWMLQVCDALGYLHTQVKNDQGACSPIIYRDMKPSNIMLRPDGYIKLIDMGIAREYSQNETEMRDTAPLGTEGYAAPEQAYRVAHLGPETDIYALGATMWALLAGGDPPNTDVLPDVREFNSNVGEGFAETIIPKCMRKDRHERYQSCAELAADLERYQELTHQYRAKQKNKVVSFAVCAILAVVCALVGVGALALRDTSITNNYEHFYSLAQKEADVASAEENYLEAISYKPQAVDSYVGLIDCYKKNGAFTTEDKQQFDSVLKQYQATLEKTGTDYSSLCYEIGKLYWYYYTYGTTENATDSDNQTTRIKASTAYFKVAAEDESFSENSTAQTYYAIAKFTSEIESAIREGSESKELYAEYWNNLASLVNGIDSEPEKVKVDTCALVANSLETYMSKFKDIGGISKSEVEKTVGNVKQLLNGISPVGEDSKKIKTATLELLNNQVATKITDVYSSKSTAGSL